MITIPKYELIKESDRDEFTRKYSGEMTDRDGGYYISVRERRDGSGADGVLLSPFGIIARATGDSAMECWLILASRREQMLAN